MQLKLFILPVKNLDAAEGEMNGFLRAHRVLAVKKEFVADGENSFWTFCVEYLDSAVGAASWPVKGPKVDYKEVLKPEEFEVFSRLREWRKAAAEKEGVPVYTVLTNEQLAQMVQKKVSTKAGLKEIEGVGEARVEKKNKLGRGAYVRYMDDFVVWGGCREELKAVRDRVREFLTVELKLELKADPSLNRTALGMDFLGYRLFPRVVRLARRSKIRFARKFRRYERAFVEGVWSEAQLQQRTTALLAFVMPAESGGFRRHVLERFGVAAIGLEPRDPRRQLEQQWQELPVSEPQQQQPVQQEQQYWVPGCPGPSSTGAPEGAPADPAAIPSCAKD